ncbi:(2Fe-2S)-binding protein [Desulfopila sp. IMCC35008]|uniref:(2Fe-2S)-binding protein n=1 Tax=Desulfopila sp. IMCC35008 TaxID=2653858 RepID=UPI0013D4460B|nr:(2Fe-2S)-binding protein [Desulfopila sp. IMCC35008]
MSNTNSKFVWSTPSANQETVTVTFEGENCTVPSGVTVAAALLGHDDNHFCRSAAENDTRAPYCLMGVCFECLVEIDGQKNRQACLEPVYDGMRVKRQHSPGSN